jgi:hypothetical protein
LNHKYLPANSTADERRTLILNDIRVKTQENCLTLFFQTYHKHTTQFEARLDLQAILASIAASQSTQTPLTEPGIPQICSTNNVIDTHLHHPIVRKAHMYENFDFNVCPPITLPTRGCFPPSDLSRTSGEMAQNMVNIAALLPWFDVVWYFAIDRTHEFGATVTSVFYEGRTLRYNCLVVDPKTGRRERRAELSELYVESAHAVGMSMALSKEQGMPADTPKDDAFLYPCMYCDKRNDFIQSIFVVTEFRGPHAAPLHADLASAVRLSDLFGRISGLYFRSDPDRCVKAIRSYQAFLADAQFGVLAPLFALARQARPSCMMVAERVGLAGELLKVPDSKWHRRPCQVPSTLKPQLGSTMITVAEMITTIDRAKIAATEAYKKATPSNDTGVGVDKSVTGSRKKRKRVTKASESVRGTTVARRLAPHTCPCQVVPQLPEGARGPDMILSVCSTRLEYVVQRLPQAHIDALDNVSRGLACFKKLQFPLCQPPVCFDAAHERYVALNDVTITKAIQEPMSRLDLDLSTLQEATEAEPHRIKTLMLISLSNSKTNVSSQHRRESVLRGREIRKNNSQKRARCSSNNDQDATKARKSAECVTFKAYVPTNTTKSKKSNCKIAKPSTLSKECRDSLLQEISLVAGTIEEEIHNGESVCIDASHLEHTWDPEIVPPFMLMEFGSGLLVSDDEDMGENSSFNTTTVPSGSHNSNAAPRGVAHLQPHISTSHGKNENGENMEHVFHSLEDMEETWPSEADKYGDHIQTAW